MCGCVWVELNSFQVKRMQPSLRPRSRSRSRSPVPKCAPHRRGSTLLSEGGSPTSQLLPTRLRRSAFASLTSALARPGSRAPGVWGFCEHRPRFLTAHVSPCARRPAARQNPSDAAEARRRSRDKRRRFTRKQAKLFMWREIKPQARRDDTSSDDHEHNTSNLLLLLLCAHALVAPALLSGFAELDELSVAQQCCALDICTIMQQDYYSADQESSVRSGSLVSMSLDSPCELVRPQAPARVDVPERLRAQFLQSRFTVALNGEHHS